MSFLNRFQPLALSGLLALTATSCPPDRFLSFGRGEGDDGSLACPVRSLPVPGDGPEGLHRSFEGLAALGIGPEMFHLENLDRLQPLTGVCSPTQIDRFAGLQSVLSERISRMEPAAIATTLEGFYRQAYVYNETDRTMAAGDSPAQQEAKRRLDLWIAAVDQRAFQDSAFLDRIWGEKRIRAVMALNSPHLNAVDRGDLERMFRAEPGGDEALTRLFNERPMDELIRQFDWLRTYDGRNEKFFEDAYWRSQTEVYTVFESHFDRERMLRLAQAAFPREAVARFMDERGYGPDYRHFLSLDADALVQHYHEVMLGVTPQARPASRRRLVEELQIMGVVFGQRGLDPQRELERRGIESMVQSGFSREDAELMFRLQTGAVPYTHDRLDDYRARHGLLGEYRTLYRDMITHSLEVAFSPFNRNRYGMWGAFVLNRSMTKIPIFLEDLDRIRWSVASEVVDSIQFGPPGFGFETRDTSRPQWYTPSDLGLCQSLTGGPLVTAGLARFNGRTANELICNNVELMAFLPNNLEVDHALATAIGVFGVITVRNSDTALVGGRSANVSWTPGALLETLTHEASHVDWFRENFDRDSQRLPMLALNERRAYATGSGYVRDFAMSGLSGAEEAAHLGDRMEFVDRVVDAANRTLGVSPAQPARMEADYWEPHWDAEQPGRLMFQPPDVLAGEEQQRMLARAFGAPSESEIANAWAGLFMRAMQDLRLTRAEQNEALQALNTLESTANGPDAGFYFLSSHPITRVVNAIGVRLGLYPSNAIDMSAPDWANLKRTLGRRSIDRNHLFSSPAPRPR